MFHMIDDNRLIRMGLYETLIFVDANYLLTWYVERDYYIQYPTHIGLLEFCYDNIKS